MIGAIKAKLEARNTGTLPRVTSWNTNVPAPAVKSATLAFNPVRSGTRTSAPKATKSIWAPMTICLGLRLNVLSCRFSDIEYAPEMNFLLVCPKTPGKKVSLPGSLLGAEDLVSSVAEAGQNVADLVQFLVDRCDIDVYIRMFLLQCGNPLRCGNQE